MDKPFYQELGEIFKGYDKAYGVFRIDHTKAGKKKKGVAKTIKEPLRDDAWQMHCEGVEAIGIVPLDSNNKVNFSAIDIDDYSIDAQELNDRISKNNLPLILFRSKSGGAHLFIFYEEPAEAKKSREALAFMSEMLGFPGVEIFPKQDFRENEEVIGNWINMPYFNAEKTDRYAIDPDGNAISAERVIDYIWKRRIRPQSLDHFIEKPSAPKKTTQEVAEPLKGGPPCLNRLIVNGFPENTRNNTLFNIGVYFKKSHPSQWKEATKNFNAKHIEPPLPEKEINTLIRSLDVKDYNYRCRETPISTVCDRQRCLTCQYGVKPTDELPKLGRLTKTLTDPPIWHISVVDGGRLELTTEELQSPRKFQLACMDALNVMPPICKPEEWRQIIKGLLENVQVIDVTDEDTPIGRFKAILWEWLEGKLQAIERADILADKPWENDDYHHFSMKSLQKYLDRERFKELQPNKILQIIREIPGAKKEFVNIDGHGRNLWLIPTRKKEPQENES